MNKREIAAALVLTFSCFCVMVITTIKYIGKDELSSSEVLFMTQLHTDTVDKPSTKESPKESIPVCGNEDTPCVSQQEQLHPMPTHRTFTEDELYDPEIEHLREALSIAASMSGGELPTDNKAINTAKVHIALHDYIALAATGKRVDVKEGEKLIKDLKNIENTEISWMESYMGQMSIIRWLPVQESTRQQFIEDTEQWAQHYRDASGEDDVKAFKINLS